MIERPAGLSRRVPSYYKIEGPTKTFIGQIWFHKPMRSLDEIGITEEIIQKYKYHGFTHNMVNMAENSLALHHVRQQQIQSALDSLSPGEDTSTIKKQLKEWKGKAEEWKNILETYENNVTESDKQLLPEDQDHQT